MKTTIAAAAALLAALTLPAAAADLPARPYTKAPAMAAPLYNWTGFYAGINGGYAWGKSDWTGGGLTTGNFNVKGGLVGGTLGYNVQMGSWVWGLEADLDWTDINGNTATNCNTTNCETRNSWLGTARGRLGYAMDRVLPYITGGAAFGNIKAQGVGTPTGTDSSTEVGWALGGGLEWALAPNWSVKAEYLHVDLGKANCSAAVCGAATDVDFNANIVRAGLNYRFGGPAAPY